MVKRILNLVISGIVASSDGFRRGLQRVVGTRRNSRCVVLAYHSVSPLERSRFAEQMDVLLKKAKAVPADISVLPASGALYAVVTFDDGFQNIVDNALPELEKRNIPATLFIVTEALGSNRAWEHRGGDDTRSEQVMSTDQLRGLSSGLITIGSHTMTHPYLPGLDQSQLERELAGSRKKLMEILNRKVDLLSFPYGAFNQAILDSCKSAGFERVFTALPLFAISEANEFVTGRVGTAATDWPIEFRLKLCGAYRWLPHAYEMKRRLRSSFSPRSAASLRVPAPQKEVA